MPSALDLATLSREAVKLSSSEAHRWVVTLVPDALRAYVQLSPKQSHDVYCLRMDFGETLSEPPSVVFCDPNSRAEGAPRDWPAGLTDYFKHPPGNGNGWICNPWTREGRRHHPEWQKYQWRAKRAIWVVATGIQDILDKPGAYAGRAQ